ncbi:hypothetical protein D5R40_26975 [Okeania hirsuta]|uniref:DUF4403 family protein n=1 Tax=Okeania hirsuta TaxID=1458930 RepID=A0A3N6P519_9CYAN|nr:hypothetical protein [Okeania hirsuta]RQH27596.1 hypothetical protein D5R40_26975 [Okeania hirsuta]
MKTTKFQSILLSLGIILLPLTVSNLALASKIYVQPLKTTHQVQVQHLAKGLPLNIDGIPFTVTLDLRNAQLRGKIPKSLVQTELIKALNEFDNHSIKNTKYNKQTIRNLDFRSLDNGGLTVGFSVNLKHRERLAKVFGKEHFTPWISVTLHGTSSFGTNIRNNVVNVSYRGHDVRGQKWYGDIVSGLDSVFKKQTSGLIKKRLNRFNGMNLISLLKQGGIDKQLPLNLTIDELVKSGVKVNADFSPQGLSFVINLPETIDIS